MEPGRKILLLDIHRENIDAGGDTSATETYSIIPYDWLFGW